MLGHRVPSADGLWENVLDINQLPYLKDHVVQHSILFPAAAYVELALSAARSTLGKGIIDVEDMDIMRPLVIPTHSDPIIQTYVNPKDGEVEVSSRVERDSSEWIRHARARVSRREIQTPAAFENLAELSARLPHSVSSEEHYKASSARGLDYGLAFQGVSKVLLSAPSASRREALAEISLPLLDADGLAGYFAHPAVLDSCIQVLITLIAQTDKGNSSTIPVHLGRVRSLSPVPNRVFCHVIMTNESDRSAVANFRVLSPDGELLLQVDGARCQKVDFQNRSTAPMIAEWWRPDTAPASSLPEGLPSPAQLQQSLAEDLPAIIAANDRAAFYREIQPAFARLSAAYAAKALASLELGDSPFDISRLTRKAGIKRDQVGLLTRIVHICEASGYLSKSAGKWRWNASQRIEDPQILWRDLFETRPRYYAELMLASATGEQLSLQLRGEAVESSAALLDQASDTSPWQAPYNQIVRAAIEKLVASWPASRPIRILELTAAGGGLSAWVLPVLPAERTDYVWTDPSDAAIGRAEHRFANHRFARFAALDPKIDFLTQGQPAGYFDLVLATHALSASADAPQLLEQIAAIMAPGGMLVSIEPQNDPIQTLLFDRTISEWLPELSEAGFEDAIRLDDSQACTAGQTAQQFVLLARLGARFNKLHAPKAKEIASKRWLVLAEDSSFVQSIVQSLTAQNQQAIAKSLAANETPETFKTLLENSKADEIVLLANAGAPGDNLLAVEKQRCWHALQLVQAIEATKDAIPACHLTFVTVGAFPTANGQAPIDPGQSSLWGLGRVIGNEHSVLNIRLIDLQSAQLGEPEALCLSNELLRRDTETEVQLSNGLRYVNRERMSSLSDLAHRSSHASPSFALDFQPHAGLDSLYLRAAERSAPGPNEVEIAVAAAGLNFRDVLWVMGMLPEEAVEHGFSGPTIGMECSGQIVQVGSNVSGLKPGNRVVAFASDCFGSHVTTDANAVAVIPDDLDIIAAATIPTAFLTAYYAFDYLARLEPGETVLIHGAAGGVGMAAIQIAKLKGAKVIGTAGSPRKRRMLELLGVDHVLNSRTLEFADDVMKLTGGLGVDVVLNSLAGEAITKSLQCLRPFGRFLEIGKRDLYGNSQIGLRPFRNNLSYFGIDADTLIVERAKLAQTIFKKVVAHFAAGELRPLPFQAIPVSRAAEAFRSMQQSRHIGKLVVSMQADRHSSLHVVPTAKAIKPAATYLITGGLSGFGLATAEWLAEQGATSLALLGRRGASTEEAIAAITRLEKMGVQVRAFSADVSDRAALNQVLATVRREMAPLTGVLHAAAAIEDAPILNLTPDQLERVFQPKMIGAWNLHEATLKDPIDMFVLYSSSSALVGNPGQGAYVAANLYLDALALYRRSQNLPALSIGWGAIIARILSSLLKSSVPIDQALQVASQSMGNIPYQVLIAQAGVDVKLGKTLSESLNKNNNLFPVLIIEMLEVGEESGTTENILEQLAGHYEEEVDTTMRNLSTIIEPLLILIIGGVVGFLALALITPIYSIGNSIS